MDITIIPNENTNAPAGKLADAELHFTDGALEGLKLIGFAVWESRGGGSGRLNVTFPSRHSQLTSYPPRARNPVKEPLAFQPSGSMRRGHVAAISRVIDSRTVLLRHANWSPIDGRRGQVEDDVRAVDVSPDNDWSEVRVWYAPIQDLGTTAWPVAGFIYPTRDARPTFQLAKAEPAKPLAPSREFLKAFASFGAPARATLVATGNRSNGKPIDLIAQVASR